MKYFNWFILIAFSLLTSGCAVKQLEQNYSLSKDSTETVFVMGVKSKNADISADRFKLLMWPSDIHSDAYKIEDMWKNAAHYDFPENGYIVSSATGNDHVAFKAIELYSQDKESIIATKRVCRGQKGPVFYLPRSKVVYLGDINLKFSQGRIEYDITQDFKSAKSFIDKHYPNLRGRLQETNVNMLYSSTPCIEPQLEYIPLYIPM
jgi:hypothetical protein